jgi:exonuclease SbcD
LTSVLANPAFDYVALGHVHKHQNLNPGEGPPIVYAGSLERVDFGEEHDEKGFCIVDIEVAPSGERNTTCEFIEGPARRFVTIEVTVAAAEDPTRRILDAVDQANIDEAVVRVRCLLPEGPISSIDIGAVGRAVARAHFFAGVLLVRPTAQRQRRAAVTEEMGTREALLRYIDNLPELHRRRDRLLEYAAQIETDLVAIENGEHD